MHLSEYFVRNRGEQARLSRDTGIAQAFLSSIAKGRRITPANRCIQIEQATNGEVTRKDLRPHDWHLIWPELAEK